MATPAEPQNGPNGQFQELNLSILGIGVEYPPYNFDYTCLEKLCDRYYPKSPAIAKVLMINKYTGIEYRSAIGQVDDPFINMDRAPNIRELSQVFMKQGVPLAVMAARKALYEAQLTPADITHVVSTTCTNSSNPGYDHFVCKQLGITQPVEKVLLHGIGCSGGAAALRTGANLALGSRFMGRKARVLVLALEVSTTLVRSELDSIQETQQTRIGITLFSDCASALVLSNGVGYERAQPVYEFLGWIHRVIPDTENDLGFDVDPLGWKVVLTPRVPELVAEIVVPTFSALLASLPALPPNYTDAADFDWALHPGGATILSGVERTMKITPEHQRASYDRYINHGNSSSATTISVMDRLRQDDMDQLAPSGKVKDFVVGCAIGPGISIEMFMLKRNLNHVMRPYNAGEQTPSESDCKNCKTDAEETDIEDKKLKEGIASLVVEPEPKDLDKNPETEPLRVDEKVQELEKTREMDSNAQALIQAEGVREMKEEASRETQVSEVTSTSLFEVEAVKETLDLLSEKELSPEKEKAEANLTIPVEAEVAEETSALLSGKEETETTLTTPFEEVVAQEISALPSEKEKAEATLISRFEVEVIQETSSSSPDTEKAKVNLTLSVEVKVGEEISALSSEKEFLAEKEKAEETITSLFEVVVADENSVLPSDKEEAIFEVKELCLGTNPPLESEPGPSAAIPSVGPVVDMDGCKEFVILNSKKTLVELPIPMEAAEPELEDGDSLVTALDVVDLD